MKSAKFEKSIDWLEDTASISSNVIGGSREPGVRGGSELVSDGVKTHSASEDKFRLCFAFATAYVSSVRPIYPTGVRDVMSETIGNPENDVSDNSLVRLDSFKPFSGKTATEVAEVMAFETGTWKVCCSFVSRNGNPLK